MVEIISLYPAAPVSGGCLRHLHPRIIAMWNNNLELAALVACGKVGGYVLEINNRFTNYVEIHLTPETRADGQISASVVTLTPTFSEWIDTLQIMMT